MDFTFLTEYFVMVVVVACLVIGYVIKHATFFKWLNNDNIPVILAVVGAVLNAVVSGLSVESVVCKVYSSATGAANGGESNLIATMKNTDSDWAVSTAKTIVFTDESSADGSDRYYRFEFTLTNSNTSKNYGIDLQKIVFSAN